MISSVKISEAATAAPNRDRRPPFSSRDPKKQE